ncbi:MAG: sugar kinase [Candidatus Abyssobacteria bacterium SURF_5]|uniref:Sugar kinase n=1 Tax=Abyssobacteria bacterium (strain SURF_5) TaxID=2093360 RepID=A0A3A4P4C3_ABYX5|nr:MAG: sugar kinase [Candidatus Abyssubacteria bacterium SURF_5]
MAIPVDVVTFGETMIRFSPPDHQTFEQATTANVTIGGSESNVAVALSRLGVKTAWISKLTDNPLGKKIYTSIAAHGVDLSGVVWISRGRNATYFVELGKPPRSHRVTYDRKASAINTLQPSEINWSLFKGAKIVHLTGITAALSSNCRKLVEMMIKRARKEKALVSFDVNYRAKLWSCKRAGEILSPLCLGVDILFVNYEDAANVFGARGAPEDVLKNLQSRFNGAAVVLTVGKDGAFCRHKGQIFRSRTFLAVETDRVGAGDAFAAGFLFGFLNRDVQYSLDFASALSSLKFTIPGDLAWISRADVEGILQNDRPAIQR